MSTDIMLIFAESMETRPKILVVDDEETLCEALRLKLDADGYDTDVAYSAEDALTLDLTSYSLFILDIMMGDISGTGLARMLKSNPQTASIPIIFCTARDSEEDMIAHLDLGADDYITKPYSLKAVSARVRTVLRRGSPSAAPQPQQTAIGYKGLRIDPERKLCTVDGAEVRLPRKEYEILLKLLSHRGRIFSREEIISDIWPDRVIVLDRVVDVNITRLRHKLGPYGNHIVARSCYGYGFME